MKQNKSEKPGTFYLEMLRLGTPALAKLVVTHARRQIVDYPICYGKNVQGVLEIGYNYPNVHSEQVKLAVARFFEKQ